MKLFSHPTPRFSSPAVVTTSREDSTLCPQQDTQPLPHRTSGLRLWHVPRLQIKLSITTLTKSRWCFHAQCLLRFLLQTKAGTEQGSLHTPQQAWVPPALCQPSLAASGPEQGPLMSPGQECTPQRTEFPPNPTHPSRTRMMEFSSGAVTCLARSMAPKTCC